MENKIEIDIGNSCCMKTMNLFPGYKLPSSWLYLLYWHSFRLTLLALSKKKVINKVCETALDEIILSTYENCMLEGQLADVFVIGKRYSTVSLFGDLEASSFKYLSLPGGCISITVPKGVLRRPVIDRLNANYSVPSSTNTFEHSYVDQTQSQYDWRCVKEEGIRSMLWRWFNHLP